MATLDDSTIPLLPENFYHLYNRGNDERLIFPKEKNHLYFLKKFGEYLFNYLDTFAYCLIPNHFHFLVKIKPAKTIFKSARKDFEKVPVAFWKSMREKDIPNFENLEHLRSNNKNLKFEHITPLIPTAWHPQVAAWMVSEKMRRFFLSYSKAINIQESRKGSLFQKNFKRKMIGSEVYFTHLIWYIHNNPVHHKICQDFRKFQWSSYQSMLSKSATKLKRKEVLEWFGGKADFLEFHQIQKVNWHLLEKVVLED